MKMGLEGKIVLVTGSSGGIGAAIAENFANEKAKVILHYNSNLKAAQELGSKLSKLTEILIVQADLSNETSVRDMFNEIEKAVGYVDVLVANAGVCLDYGTPIHKKTLEKWNETLSVNLTSIFLCVREFFKGIVKAQTTAPSIVFIGSTAGVFGEAFDSDYAASKAPLNAGLLLTLKNEITKIAPLGRVNTICPSWTLTEMVKTELGDPSHVKRALQTVALRKIGRPHDVATTAVFLASSLAAGHITGQVIHLAGGMEGRVLYEQSEINLEKI